jgi:hypothetical protein
MSRDLMGSDISDLITRYLSIAGLWNPELADHTAVRDLLIECRTRIKELEWEAKLGRNLREVLDEWLMGNKPWSRDIYWLDAWWYGDPAAMKEAANDGTEKKND